MNQTSRSVETTAVTGLPRTSKNFAEAAATCVKHGGDAKYLDAVPTHMGIQIHVS